LILFELDLYFFALFYLALLNCWLLIPIPSPLEQNQFYIYHKPSDYNKSFYTLSFLFYLNKTLNFGLVGWCSL